MRSLLLNLDWVRILGSRESGVGNRESGVGSRESGTGKKEEGIVNGMGGL
ncbi:MULTISPECIES: hypothetical protein [Moorena]|nr:MULTISPECIES: hypothetical protein [Moorena]NEP33813.1 hypothetical protein [Moorena sp. SIO3B2]NEP67380.1 hypothetical protein [Moorena sp. SIO3A5]NEQ15445.1 hypothetical protein [Moorena sp. SIO3E2]NES43878.1 hypothetical protein [Moorena sp. SIO2C4]